MRGVQPLLLPQRSVEAEALTANTAALRDALRATYPPPEWQVAFEVQAVRDEGGLSFADAIAFDTRKGAGMMVHGFEFKVSRSDWLTERRKPGKHAPAANLVDYWWLVVGSQDVLRQGELPDGWGLMVPARSPNGACLVTVTPASRRLHGNADVLDRRLVAAFLSRLDPLEPRAYWEGREREAERKGYAKGRNEARRVAGARERAGAVPSGPLDLP